MKKQAVRSRSWKTSAFPLSSTAIASGPFAIAKKVRARERRSAGAIHKTLSRARMGET